MEWSPLEPNSLPAGQDFSCLIRYLNLISVYKNLSAYHILVHIILQLRLGLSSDLGSEKTWKEDLLEGIFRLIHFICIAYQVFFATKILIILTEDNKF